jgi:succinoglycan biosynthesis transport protein ExoP
LGVIPEAQLAKGKLRWRRPSAFQYARLNPLSPFAQNMKKVKSAVQVAKTGAEHGFCLGIVSSVPGEGKSTVAGNLADLLGASGRRTLLLDFDLGILDRKDTQCHGAAPNYTFMDGAKLRAAVTPIEDGQPPASDLLRHPEDLLGSRQMDQFLSQCRQDYEYVLLDCPSIELLPDTTVVTRYLDALIVVIEWGRLPFEHFAASLASLGGGSCKVLGVVLSKVATRGIDVSRSSASPTYL